MLTSAAAWLRHSSPHCRSECSRRRESVARTRRSPSPASPTRRWPTCAAAAQATLGAASLPFRSRRGRHDVVGCAGCCRLEAAGQDGCALPHAPGAVGGCVCGLWARRARAVHLAQRGAPPGLQTGGACGYATRRYARLRFFAGADGAVDRARAVAGGYDAPRRRHARAVLHVAPRAGRVARDSLPPPQEGRQLRRGGDGRQLRRACRSRRARLRSRPLALARDALTSR